LVLNNSLKKLANRTLICGVLNEVYTHVENVILILQCTKIKKSYYKK